VLLLLMVSSNLTIFVFKFILCLDSDMARRDSVQQFVSPVDDDVGTAGEGTFNC
jgi:hypothetical protein